MWWKCVKKTEPKKQGPSQWEAQWEAAESKIAALQAWRAIGEEFDYLGRRMVVIKHYSVDMKPNPPFAGIRLVPEIHARYADDNGKVHDLVLSESEVMALARAL